MVAPTTSRYPYSGPPGSAAAASRSSRPLAFSSTPAPVPSSYHAASSPSIDAAQAIADRLETGLNKNSLEAITGLLREGVQPDTVVAIVSSLAQVPR